MDYRKTVQLPQTQFPMKANLANREPERLRSWNEQNLYERLQEQGKSEGRKVFVLHDGPPYANGHIHIGHALNKILKDMVIRSKSMDGYRSPYVPGWDTHGLPIELQVVRHEGKSRTKDGLVAFREACREYALRYVDVQREEFRRLGIWGDWDRPYLTLDPEYEARQIEVFGDMATKGYIYKGLKPVYWCASCETALAEAEIEYHDHRSPSIFVRFPVRDSLGKFEGPVDLIIWTTTPWTLPANLAVAVHPDLDYVIVESDDGRRFLVAEGLALSVFAKLSLGSPRVVQRFAGNELEGVVAWHPFADRPSPIILGEHVTLEQGSGLVHTAPGHGLEDYEVGQRYGLDILAPVDARGRMTEEAGPYAGLTLDEANKAITADMERDGSLLLLEVINHQYAHCWRCKNPVAFRATEQWFASVEGFRDKALEAIDQVKWIPSWGIERIRNMVQDRGDWCISRQRAWGVPIPIFYCKSCHEPLLTEVSIKAVAELFRKEGSNGWYARGAEEILPVGTACNACGHTNFDKEEDTMDVWFDSGSSHHGVLDLLPDLTWPANMYLEGSDQHRGWFQSSLLTAVATRGAAPYREVLTHGFIVDGEGRKMSKSVGNTVAPDQVIKTYGADILRLWASSADYRGDIRVSNEILKQMAEVYRRIRNTCRFLLGNLHDFDARKDRVSRDRLEEIDRWALMRTRQLHERCVAAYREYSFHTVHQLVHNFCAVDMGGFYLDVIKDRLYCDGPSSASRRAAQTVLSDILQTLVKLIAPILVFTADEVWEYMDESLKDAESVHLSVWTSANTEEPADSPDQDHEFERRWEALLRVKRTVAKALERARNEKVIGSSSEAAIWIKANDEVRELLEQRSNDLAPIFIVSSARLVDAATVSAVVEEEGNLTVGVDRADGEKCERCWRHADGVGDHSDHPTLCNRCADVVQLLL